MLNKDRRVGRGIKESYSLKQVKDRLGGFGRDSRVLHVIVYP